MQRRYNTILRSVAVIIGFKEKSPISSAPINWISAYSLLSKYHTTERFSISNEIKPPMKSEDALSYIKGNIIDEIVVPPFKENFDIATEILLKTTVKCYNAEPPESVSTPSTAPSFLPSSTARLRDKEAFEREFS